MNKITVAVFTALALANAAAPLAAIAASPGQFATQRVAVAYDDLDIHSEAGARILYARLSSAAEKVCSVDSAYKSRMPSDLAGARQCFRETLAAALTQVDSDELRALHLG